MKKTGLTETQIVSILKQQEAGKPVKDMCREPSISDATFYNWKAKYGGWSTPSCQPIVNSWCGAQGYARKQL